MKLGEGPRRGQRTRGRERRKDKITTRRGVRTNSGEMKRSSVHGGLRGPGVPWWKGD